MPRDMLPTAKLTLTPTVGAVVSAQSLTAGGSVTIESVSATTATTLSDTRGGGAIKISEAHSDTIVDSAPTTAGVGADTQIVAAADFLLSSASDHTLSATAVSLGGGVIDAHIAETTSQIDFETTADIGEGAEITAGGLLHVHADSKTDGTLPSVAPRIQGPNRQGEKLGEFFDGEKAVVVHLAMIDGNPVARVPHHFRSVEGGSDGPTCHNRRQNKAFRSSWRVSDRVTDTLMTGFWAIVKRRDEKPQEKTCPIESVEGC